MKRVLPVLTLLLAASPAAAQQTQPPADSVRVYEMAEVEQLPSPTNAAELRAALEALYPTVPLQPGTGGRVMIAFVVGADGAVGQASVVTTSDTALDALALAAVEVLRFTPGSVGGTAVATRVAMPIQWQAPPPSPPCEGAAAGEGAERVYLLTEVEERPRPLNRADVRGTLTALYPEDLRQAGVRGEVQVSFRVDCAGVPRNMRVVYSTNPRFNGPALRSAATLRFAPARVNGRAVESWVILPLQWP